MDQLKARQRARVRFGAIALGLLVVGIAGYVGFVAFVGAERTVAGGVLALAAGTGFAAFFSPCSFPLLLTFLSRRAADSAAAALASALRVAAGATMLLASVAVVIALGGTALGAVVEFDSVAGRVLRLGIGATLVILGLEQAGVWPRRMQWMDGVAGTSARLLDPARVTNPARRDVLYGLGYLLAGFG